jgi:hypothetical protein
MAVMLFPGVVHMNGEPRVVVNDNQIRGITVIASNAGAFGSETARLVGTIPQELTPLLPYAVIIRNSGTLPITGIDILFDLTIAGKHITRNYLYTSFDMSGSEMPIIAPGATLLIFPEHWVNSFVISKQSLPVSSQLNAAVTRALSIIGKSQEVSISIDSVIHSDGKLKGPDLAGTLQKFQQSIDGYRGFRNEILTRLRRGESNGAVIAWLNEKAHARLIKTRSESAINRASVMYEALAEEYLQHMVRGERAIALQKLETATPEKEMRRIINIRRGTE